MKISSPKAKHLWSIFDYLRCLWEITLWVSKFMVITEAVGPELVFPPNIVTSFGFCDKTKQLSMPLLSAKFTISQISLAGLYFYIFSDLSNSPVYPPKT